MTERKGSKEGESEAADAGAAEASHGAAVSTPRGKTVRVSLFSLFWGFFVVSAFTLGGGYAMVPVMARLVVKKKWCDEKEFYDIFALAQSFPGPFSLNSAVIVGWRLRAFPGAAAGFVGIFLPPVLAVLALSLVYGALEGNPLAEAFLAGTYGTVIGIVAVLVWKSLRGRTWKPLSIVLGFAGAVGLFFFTNLVLPIFILLVGVAYFGTEKWKS